MILTLPRAPCIKQWKFCYNDGNFTSSGSEPSWYISTMLQCPLEDVWMHPQFLHILPYYHYSNNKSVLQCWFIYLFSICMDETRLYPLWTLKFWILKKKQKKNNCSYLLVKWSLYKEPLNAINENSMYFCGWQIRRKHWQDCNRFLCLQHVFHLLSFLWSFSIQAWSCHFTLILHWICLFYFQF